MKAFHPHRFPPLSRFVQPGVRSASASQWQAALADGFKQGMAEGHAKGHELGVADGRRDGHAEGLEEGRREGMDDGRRQTLVSFELLAKPIDAMLKALRKLQAEYQKAQREEVVELVAKVARQVIRAELALQPAQILNLVDEALSAMPATRGEIEVYLNPEEAARIRELDPKRAKRWVLIPDPRMEAGECRVKSGHHEVDAGCQQRLVAVMEQVRAQLVEHPGETAVAA
jgi:flagellar assembly protein FliH